ncbi:MAG TPA: hypothetical protein VM032_01865 [Vicinamibacterales bacterium]|nr:hypothetical protein [Vicinamibacterales bacterium]
MFGIFFALLCTLGLIALWRRPRYYGGWGYGGCGCGAGRGNCGPQQSGQPGQAGGGGTTPGDTPVSA